MATAEYTSQVLSGNNAHHADSTTDGLTPKNGFEFEVPDGLLVNNRMNFTPQGVDLTLTVNFEAF